MFLSGLSVFFAVLSLLRFSLKEPLFMAFYLFIKTHILRKKAKLLAVFNPNKQEKKRPHFRF